jgi:hypothetical protein
VRSGQGAKTRITILLIIVFEHDGEWQKQKATVFYDVATNFKPETAIVPLAWRAIVLKVTAFQFKTARFQFETRRLLFQPASFEV